MMQPEQYDLLYQCEERMWWFVGMRRIAKTLLGSRLRSGLRCLEAGCGTGFNSVYYREAYGWQVFPFDLSGDALRFARARGVERLVNASLTTLPYADESFDCVSCMDVIALLDEPAGRAALEEMRRVLRPGGFVLLRTAALEWMRGGHSAVSNEQRRYSLAELVNIVLATGFRIERATYANALLLPIAALKRKVLEPLHLASSEGDVRPAPSLLNMLFLAALRAEDRLLKRVNKLPLGVSAIVVATR